MTSGSKGVEAESRIGTPFGGPTSSPYLAYSRNSVTSFANSSRAQSDGSRFKVREGGVNVCHGQRELLCHARVLLTRLLIVILDEATTSVDPATDERVQLLLRQRLQGVSGNGKEGNSG